MAKLRGLDGDWRGLDYPLAPGRGVVIGRRGDSGIAIVHPKVSRRHADVRLDRDGQAWLKDHGSSNGTYLNGIRVAPDEEQPLGPGDEIQVGPALFRYFSADARLPDVEIPGHEMLDVIAEGGMSTIYLARQTAMARDVAVKVLNPVYARRREFVERFIQEARAAGRLNHPNIIQVHFVGKVGDDTYYFTMEYMRGGSLVARIGERENFRLAPVLAAGARIADALAYAHERGIVHRDIKPDNILFSASGDVKLADLGIAKTDDNDDFRQPGRQRVLGTPHYMSPEQASARPVDGRSDLYSLGATLYHALAGRPVFENADPAEIMRRHVHEEPESVAGLAPPETPETICALVDQLLRKNPADRPQTAAEVRDRLDDAARRLDRSAESAAPASPAAAAVPRAPRYGRLLWPSAAALAVFALAWLAYVALRARSRDETGEADSPSRPDPGLVDSSAPEEIHPGELLQRARQWFQAGRLDEAEKDFTALAAWADGRPDFKDSADEAARGLASIARERERRAAVAAADAAWREYTESRDRDPEASDDHLAALDALRAAHPALADRVEPERRKREYARDDRARADYERLLAKADRLADARDYDGALALFDRFLADEPRHPSAVAAAKRRGEIEAVARAAAAKALKELEDASSPADRVARAADYRRAIKYAEGEREIAAREKETLDALRAAFALQRTEARELYRTREFARAASLWRRAVLTYARTPLEAEAAREFARADAFAKLHDAFLQALTPASGANSARKALAPLPGDFPVAELAGRQLARHTPQGIQYAQGPGWITAPWESIPPAALAALYEHVLPPDAPERGVIDDFREATR